MHTTEPHALQAILKVVNDPGAGKSLQQRWQQAIGVSTRSPEFAIRHAEVVGLLTETVRQIKSLPANARADYEPSILPWWNVVVAPDSAWGNGITGNIVQPEHIRILGALGQVIESRMEATSAAPGGFKIEAIREQCEEWKNTLADIGLSANLRNLLIERIDHLIWVVEHADLLGYARVARAADELTGQLAMATPRVPDEYRKRWTDRFKAWTGVLIAFTAFNVSATTAIESSTNLAKQIESSVNDVMDIVDGEVVEEDEPPAIGGGREGTS